MKDYYQILQVHRGANSNEIKRAYRRLAIQYHPDKNPDVSAEHLFKEINEAYEVLGDPGKKISYDLRENIPYQEVVVPDARPHRDPAYRQRRPPVKNYKSERQRLFEAMTPWLPIAEKVSYFAFIVTLFLAVDYFLPSERRFETIVRVDAVTYSRATEWLVIATEAGDQFELPMSSARYFHEGDPITIESSRLLKLPIYIEGETQTVRIMKSIYGSFSFVPIALLLSSGYGILNRKRVDSMFSAGLVTFLVLIVTTIIYLLIN